MKPQATRKNEDELQTTQQARKRRIRRFSARAIAYRANRDRANIVRALS